VNFSTGLLEVSSEVVKLIAVQLQILLHTRDICIALWHVSSFHTAGQGQTYNITLIQIFECIPKKPHCQENDIEPPNLDKELDFRQEN
jgi:hypothetical protein